MFNYSKELARYHQSSCGQLVASVVVDVVGIMVVAAINITIAVVAIIVSIVAINVIVIRC